MGTFDFTDMHALVLNPVPMYQSNHLCPCYNKYICTYAYIAIYCTLTHISMDNYPDIITVIKTHDSESRGQEEAAVRDE